jgi:hypothetical protein
MKKIIIPFVISSIVLLTSCSPKVPFTQGIRDKYKLSEAELKSIQFYTSDVIVLKRGEMSEKEKDTKEGTLTIKGGNKVEQIIIKPNTPCVVQQVYDGNRISVAFEDGKEKYLVFGSMHSKNGYYLLQLLNGDNNKETINYGEKLYYASRGSDQVFLVLKIKSLNKFELDQKIVKGKKVQ